MIFRLAHNGSSQSTEGRLKDGDSIIQLIKHYSSNRYREF
ncbi:hypothetical protein HMPREF9442_00487 [Paraprevotella xylaniphila YIT 11841]|uniref:Uncharacterized protein n=1 Tax=Paraprevotella xylaniphila YIT 11841 TaxID=762982 RepID=F3QQP5_9BACT|nr:hypothetical protein HMPREF9442_00487 [Paraprevotella xylaniphila YIT 11841]